MDMDNAWENFLEAIAALISKALTDKETEKVIAGFSNFQQRLQRLSRYKLFCCTTVLRHRDILTTVSNIHGVPLSQPLVITCND
jgi:hypothetical protein